MLLLTTLLVVSTASADPPNKVYPPQVMAVCDGYGSAPRDGHISSIKESHCAAQFDDDQPYQEQAVVVQEQVRPAPPPTPRVTGHVAVVVRTPHGSAHVHGGNCRHPHRPPPRRRR